MRLKLTLDYHYPNPKSPGPDATTTDAPHSPEDPVVHRARGEQPFHVGVEFWVDSEGFLQGRDMLKLFEAI